MIFDAERLSYDHFLFTERERCGARGECIAPSDDF